MNYKLKQIYPNSPKLGTIITRRIVGEDYWSYDNSSVVLFAKDHPENYPEFWELVVEKDYEILSYIDNNNIFTVEDNSEILERLNLKIYSIKRLSDNEIFTIGDKITSSLFSKLTDIDIIKHFYIPDENFCKIWTNIFNINDIIFGTNKFWQSNLHHTIKVKQPLFTTEDGVDIFEGDEFYFLQKDWLKYLNNYGKLIASKGTIAELAYKRFSTKEKAEEYILLNKPCLSLKDIEFAISKTNNAEEKRNKLKDLVKSKIQQSV
jgi:hypothetical protein